MSEPLPAPFAGLTPDTVLDAIDAAGLFPSGQVLALNSYENRVFQVGLDEPLAGGRFVIAKFYRPERWSDAQILEEHAFLAELAAAEVPAVAPLEIGGASLLEHAGYRYALFPRRGGRAPELEDRHTLEWLGRYLGRIHAVGARRPYLARPELSLETYGRAPRALLLEGPWLPPGLDEVYAGVSQLVLDGIERAFERAGEVTTLRLHGDVHEGNVLWTPDGPHFVDFDDSRMGPAVQDLWLLLGHGREEQQRRLADLLAGYEDFAEFDRRELHLVEALRSLRLIHYSAWIASRWHDPAFPAAFPWFDSPRYWEARILELREQVAAMDETPLVA